MRLHPKTPARYTDVSGCIQHIVSKHGGRALWQGWSATIIRNVPANALFFPVNELLKLYMAQQANIAVGELPTRQKLMAGAAAGLSYWTLTYPLDAVKSRIMATGYERRVPYLQVVKKMRLRDFLVGIVPCAMRGRNL
jgi:solute carrier family 25 carnitine/acylcarnitine transporter 20/29